jgi:hypothetical protein
MSWNSSVSAKMDYGLYGWGLIPGRSRDLFSPHSIQTGYEDHPATYPVGTDGSFPSSKSSQDVKLTNYLHLVLRPRMVELYLNS